MTRTVPIHSDTARLIYQTWQHKMVEIDQGHMVYDWHHMPGDVKQAWEESVSIYINWLNENLIKGLADQLRVPVDVRCDRVHR